MSHTTEINDILFTDIKALEGALAELREQGIKCTLEKDATPRAFYENQNGLGKTDYVIRLADAAYDVGLYKVDGKAGYVARTDLFMNSVANVLGCGCPPGSTAETQQRSALGKLYQKYAIHATIRQSIAKGYTVRRVNNSDGTVRLVVGGV